MYIYWCIYIYTIMWTVLLQMYIYIYIYISSLMVYCDSGVSYSGGCQDIQYPGRVKTTFFFCCTSIASINIYLYICVNIYIHTEWKVYAGIQVAHLYMYVYTFTHKIANANTMSKHTFNYIYIKVYIQILFLEYTSLKCGMVLHLSTSPSPWGVQCPAKQSKKSGTKIRITCNYRCIIYLYIYICFYTQIRMYIYI
jgi:hypothetical protein